MTAVLERLLMLQTALGESSSSLNKCKVLSLVKDDTEILELLKMVYNPDIKFHVTSTHILKYSSKQTLLIPKLDIIKLLESLSTRTVTGHAALELVSFFMKKLSEPLKKLVLNILDKDLKVGVNQKIINKALDNLIPEFSVALGTPFDESFIKPEDTWLISRKLDGVRCICIAKSKTDIRFYSRTGKEFFTLDKIKEFIVTYYSEPVVYDGEITVTVGGKEDFQKVMKGINRKNHTIDNVMYNIFDVLTLDEFWSKKSKRVLSERLSSATIPVLKQFPYSELDNLMVKSKDNNWEGLIVRKDTVYKGSRSKDILKVKEFFTEEYTVDSIEIGNMRVYNKAIGNYEETETLTAVHITHSDCDVRVGSGFSMVERRQFCDNPEDIIGKLISVRYFSETTSARGNISLRFPTFKGVYGIAREY